MANPLFPPSRNYFPTPDMDADEMNFWMPSFSSPTPIAPPRFGVRFNADFDGDEANIWVSPPEEIKRANLFSPSKPRRRD